MNYRFSYRLTADANLQLINLQEELSKRNDDSISQQEEIKQLLTQAVDLQRRCRELSGDKDTLETALQFSHECQAELSHELLDIKEKYELLLRAYHELQEELRRTRHSSPPNIFPLDPDGEFSSRQSLGCLNYMPFSESLAAEIESSLGSEGYESELSSLNTFCMPSNGLIGALSGRRSNADSRGSDERFDSPQPSKFNDGLGLMARNKLKIVKPFEGSQTLRKWKQLATPHLGVILESHSGVQSKTLKGVDDDLVQMALKKEEERKSRKASKEESKAKESEFVGKLFEPTSSIYTLTTTSLSQCKEVTIVTPSFSSLQLATGHAPPLTSVSSTCSAFTANRVVVSTNSDFATISISKSDTSSSSLSKFKSIFSNKIIFNSFFNCVLFWFLANYLSNILWNTSSYLSSRSPSSTIVTTVATSPNSNDCQLIHSLPAVSCVSATKQTPSIRLDSNQSICERPSNLPIGSQSNSEGRLKSPCTLRSPLQASFAGFAALNTGNGPSGVLMRGSMTGSAKLVPGTSSQPTSEPIKPSTNSTTTTTTTVTYLSGFNALLINSTVCSLSPTSDKNFIGKMPTIKTLRKGGLV
jgi:hypothetical protein